VVALGLVLLVLCVALGAGVVLSNPDAITAEAFGVTLSNVSIGGLFLVGAGLGGLAVLALGLMLGGGARKRAKHKAHKREVQTTTAENARLQEQLERTGTVAPYPTEGRGRDDAVAESRGTTHML
jgi:hypothetical protein